MNNSKPRSHRIFFVFLFIAVFIVLISCGVFSPLPAQAELIEYFKGTDYELHIFDIKGREKGPTVLIIGGIQGDEPGGYLSADSYADIALKKGRLILVPRANLPSIILNCREINADMNRKFRTRSQRIYEEKVVAILKKLIQKSDVLLNLHDGSGFYRPVWISTWKNPMRFGQSIIADAETYYSKRFHRTLELGKTAREVAVAVNRKIRNRTYHFHFNNHNTLSPKTKHRQQRNSATYYALTVCGIPAFGIETSKFLPSTHLKVLYHNLVVNEFLKKFGVVLENPRVYMEPPRLAYLVVSINASQPTVVYDGQTLTLARGDKVCVSGCKANYTRGITVDLLGYGTRNDFKKTFIIKGNTTLLVRKDRRIFAKVNLETTENTKRVESVSCISESHLVSGRPYLLVKVNGELKAAALDTPFKFVEGDILELIDIVMPSVYVRMKLNFLGYVGNWKNNTGEDRGYRIDTGRELLRRYSQHKKGKVYLVKATSRGHTRYTFKMEMLRPHLKEIVLYANGEWQHFGNKGALCVYGEKEELKIGVIQTIPFTRNGLCVKILGKTYRIPSSMSCREPLVIPLSGLSGDVRALTVRIQRGNINLGRVFLVCPLKSGLENSR
jgi:hypothetical protein